VVSIFTLHKAFLTLVSVNETMIRVWRKQILRLCLSKSSNCDVLRQILFLIAHQNYLSCSTSCNLNFLKTFSSESLHFYWNNDGQNPISPSQNSTRLELSDRTFFVHCCATIQMKAVEYYFHMKLFIIGNKMVQIF